ncbi:188_t:CDS:2 [Funneliformis mosseae]|uniref:188_t:CDS:1 n=1 Tax=Funneliformis mosseae TaxID=27381 RepID=A0A9N9BDX4_FUNMO|nr:188_t:CDS:2 [Funneliformis mosseae]
MKRFSSTLPFGSNLNGFDINRFLDETKSTVTISDNKSSLKWIPYNEFSNINEIGRGGFGVVYEAIWHDAPEKKFDLIWNKKRVALKVLSNSTDELLIMFKQFKEIPNHRTQIGEAELIRLSMIEHVLSEFPSKRIHPEAIYTSRLLEFTQLPQPRNADPVSIQQSSLVNRSVHLVSASDFGKLAARRRANSVTSHNRRPNKQKNNRRSVQIQSVSATFNEKRFSRSFNSEEVAESMRRLSLSSGSKDLNAINEDLFEE